MTLCDIRKRRRERLEAREIEALRRAEWNGSGLSDHTIHALSMRHHEYWDMVGKRKRKVKWKRRDNESRVMLRARVVVTTLALAAVSGGCLLLWTK